MFGLLAIRLLGNKPLLSRQSYRWPCSFRFCWWMRVMVARYHNAGDVWVDL